MGVAGLIRLLQDYAKMEGTACCRHRFRSLPLYPRADGKARLGTTTTVATAPWRDFGQNYLMSLQESGNPIIYTNGDNDTFPPFWYNQETEGFRTDARTCNLSYLQTDWYIDQMKRPPTTVLLSPSPAGPYGVRRRHQRIRPHPA